MAFRVLIAFVTALWLPVTLLAAESSSCSKDAHSKISLAAAAAARHDPSLDRFRAIPQQLHRAYLNGNDTEVESLATEELHLASQYPCDWTYGDAIENANRYLGLLSLRRGDLAAADEFLLRSGNNPGSPIENNLGPNLDLANQLLRLGQVHPVEQYLTEVQSFWAPGRPQVAKWLNAIQAGQRPFLNGLKAYGTLGVVGGVGLVLILLAVPELIVLVFIGATRRRLRHRLSFFLIASVLANASMWPIVAIHSVESKAPTLVLLTPILVIFLLSRLWIHRFREPATASP